MDHEGNMASLISTTNQLEQENNQLKAIMGGGKDNMDLKARMLSFNCTCEEDLAAHSKMDGKSSQLCESTCDETQFLRGLQQSKLKQEQRSSSPADFKSFIQSSILIDKREVQSCQAEDPADVIAPERLLGEIVYQLDRRILCHIFQGHKRFYGFTLLNIPDKIMEVSTHPLTGKVDEGYRLYLTQRYTNLMEHLNQLGYKPLLHPPFSEFIVNTYGILRERPGEHSTLSANYNSPDFLRKLIMTTAPRNLQKELMLLLSCLCTLADNDRKPLLLY